MREAVRKRQRALVEAGPPIAVAELVVAPQTHAPQVSLHSPGGNLQNAADFQARHARATAVVLVPEPQREDVEAVSVSERPPPLEHEAFPGVLQLLNVVVCFRVRPAPLCAGAACGLTILVPFDHMLCAKFKTDPERLINGVSHDTSYMRN